MNRALYWFDISYLEKGSERQRICFRILKETEILSILSKFTPVVIGTIPIGIHIPESDIDIACSTSDINDVRTIVRRYFGSYNEFSDSIKEETVYVASFRYEGQEIEVYAESRPVTLQHGFRHMIIEDRVLKLTGSDFRDEVINLKLKGYKTEPAFGQLLGMQDAYTELLVLEYLTDEELKRFIQKDN